MIDVQLCHHNELKLKYYPTSLTWQSKALSVSPLLTSAWEIYSKNVSIDWKYWQKLQSCRGRYYKDGDWGQSTEYWWWWWLMAGGVESCRVTPYQSLLISDIIIAGITGPAAASVCKVNSNQDQHNGRYPVQYRRPHSTLFYITRNRGSFVTTTSERVRKQ